MLLENVGDLLQRWLGFRPKHVAVECEVNAVDVGFAGLSELTLDLARTAAGCTTTAASAARAPGTSTAASCTATASTRSSAVLKRRAAAGCRDLGHLDQIAIAFGQFAVVRDGDAVANAEAEFERERIGRIVEKKELGLVHDQFARGLNGGKRGWYAVHDHGQHHRSLPDARERAELLVVIDVRVLIAIDAGFVVEVGDDDAEVGLAFGLEGVQHRRGCA